MSRCFPYPPPGYLRNPAAVAEAETTAKLQKREKTEKKEKRSDKKARRQGETKHSKHSHKKRKHEADGTTGQEPKTSSKESVEQLEKSGLTEEHDAPFVQTVRNSPESSQDSSKRRKVLLPVLSQAKNGNILRIKIKQDQDSPRRFEQPSVKQVGFGSSQLNKPNSTQQHKVKINSAGAVHQRINVDPQVLQKQGSAQHPLKSMRGDQQMMKVVKQIDPKLSAKWPLGRGDPHPVEMAQKDLPKHAVPARVFQRVEPQVPSAEIRRKCPPVCPKVPQEVNMSDIYHLENVQPPLVQNLKLGATGIDQLQQPISSVAKEEPSTSGRNADSVQGQEMKQSKSERKKGHKAEKKEKKFRDLFVTWSPPSFEVKDTDDCAQDWLFGSTRNSDASMINCRASDGSQSMEQQPSLPDMATFLPDLQIYQLPFVVPF